MPAAVAALSVDSPAGVGGVASANQDEKTLVLKSQQSSLSANEAVAYEATQAMSPDHATFEKTVVTPAPKPGDPAAGAADTDINRY